MLLYAEMNSCALFRQWPLQCRLRSVHSSVKASILRRAGRTDVDGHPRSQRAL